MGNCHVADVVEARFSQIILYKKYYNPMKVDFQCMASFS